MAAARRGLAGLQPLLTGLSRLGLAAELGGSTALPCLGAWQAGASLISLRSFAPAAVAPTRSRGGLGLQGQRGFAASAASQGEAQEEASESLEEIRARIFGTHIGNGERSGRKLLRRKLLGETVVEWYPQDIVKADPFMLDIKAEKAKLKLDRLRRRGKAPPKKGAGKRSGKK